jgi:hypothetical protein
VVHGTGFQSTDADDLGREEIFPLVEEKVVALSTASDCIVSDVATEVVSSTLN